MKKFIPAILYAAIPSAFVLCQSISPSGGAVSVSNPLDRFQRLSKRFPPEVIVPAKDRYPARLSRSYCVYPSPDKQSLSIKPCQTMPRKLRLVPPLQTERLGPIAEGRPAQLLAGSF